MDNSSPSLQSVIVCHSFDEGSQKCVVSGIEKLGGPSNFRHELPYRKGCAVVRFRSEFTYLLLVNAPTSQGHFNLVLNFQLGSAQ